MSKFTNLINSPISHPSVHELDPATKRVWLDRLATLSSQNHIDEFCKDFLTDPKTPNHLAFLLPWYTWRYSEQGEYLAHFAQLLFLKGNSVVGADGVPVTNETATPTVATVEESKPMNYLSGPLTQKEHPKYAVTTVTYSNSKREWVNYDLPYELGHIELKRTCHNDLGYWETNYRSLDNEYEMVEDQESIAGGLANVLVNSLNDEEDSAVIINYNDRCNKAIINALVENYPQIKIMHYSQGELRRVHWTNDPDYIARNLDSADCRECGENIHYCDCEDD